MYLCISLTQPKSIYIYLSKINYHEGFMRDFMANKKDLEKAWHN